MALGSILLIKLLAYPGIYIASEISGYVLGRRVWYWGAETHVFIGKVYPLLVGSPSFSSDRNTGKAG